MDEHNGKVKLREASVAGIFYPDEANVLEEDLRRLLESAPEPRVHGAIAIASPHAGYGYSGDLAALAWKSALGRDVSQVLLLAPIHHPSESLIYLPEADYFDCPLGAIPVDRSLVEELRDCGTVFSMNDIPHFEEHGIEVQLPFLRFLFPGASIVPVLLGKPSPTAIKALASGISIVFGELKNSLIVLSVDLATNADPALAAVRSDRLLEATSRGDWRAILDLETRGETDSCGAGCLAAWLASPLSAGFQSELLGRHDSTASRQSGDEPLVHYAALAWTKRRE